MWKYKCKSQFLTLIFSFAAGMALGAFLYFTNQNPGFSLTYGLNEMNMDPAVLSQTTAFIHQYAALIYILSYGLFIGGVVDVIIIAQFLMNQFHVTPMAVFLGCILLSRFVMVLGTLMYVPMLLITLYGWLSLKSTDRALFKAHNLEGDNELIRMYQIHHPMVESVKEMAENCARTIRKVTWIYTLGVVAIFALVFAVDNIIIVMMAAIFYMITLKFLLRYRAGCILPITSLLYNDCNPQACASAIIYFSKARTRKGSLQMQSLFAQCCIYMDDPQLAQDALITYPRKDPSSILTYWSLMSYIDYLLKDEDGLLRCKEEASQVNMRFGRTGVMIRNEEVAAIENRIRLMNSDFNSCKKYYLNIYNNTHFNYEKVDSAYYIALISYVQREYAVARMYFEKVVQKGNTMYFKAKAEKYLETLNAMQLDEDY